MRLVFLTLLLSSFSLQASSWRPGFFSEGFYSLTKNGVPNLGIDQVYFKSEHQFTLLKSGLEGNYPLNTPIQTPKGIVVYRKVNQSITLFYFRGLSKESVNLLMAKLNPSVTYLPFALNTAHAEDCQEALGAPVLDSAPALNLITAHTSWDLLKACLSDIGEGAYVGSVGAVTTFLDDPIQYMEKAADQIEGFLSKTADLMKGLITHPDKALRHLGEGIGKKWEIISQTVKTLSPEMKISFVCNLVGALGIDAALMFISSGTMTPKIMLTINNLSSKFSLSSKLLSLLSKEHSRVRTEKRKKFMQGLFMNKIPDEDIKHLDDLTHLDEEMSLRTLSCYIQ